MIATISTNTGEVIGPGVKPSASAPWPSMKIHVRMPSVEPRPSALISTALMGSTIEPNARNISSVVTIRTEATIRGRLSSSALMLSCSIAGVPPTRTWTPSGTGIERR